MINMTIKPNTITDGIQNYISLIMKHSTHDFVLSENKDTRGGVWAKCVDLKYRILFSKSGSIKFWAERLDAIQILTFDMTKFNVEFSKGRVSLPTKPQKMSEDEFTNALELFNSADIKRGTKAHKSEPIPQSKPTTPTLFPETTTPSHLLFMTRGKGAMHGEKFLSVLRRVSVELMSELDIKKKIMVVFAGGKRNQHVNANYTNYKNPNMQSVIKLNINTLTYFHSFKRVIYSLCHEFVHAMQYQQGTLYRNNEGVPFWRGTAFNKCKYSNRPWEKDALNRGNILADRMMERLNIKEIEL